MKVNRLLIALLLVMLVAATAALARPQESSVKRFEIGMIGDFPYAPGQQVEAQNPLDELNGEKLAFVTHDGDIKSGSTACTDDVYEREYRRFESSENPFVYTPGDNEWTDCHRSPNPSPEEADPLNRLALVRQTFFSDGYSLGREEMPLQRQSAEYPENARWSYGGATFATLHVVVLEQQPPDGGKPDRRQ